MNTENEVFLENGRVKLTPLEEKHIDDLLPIADGHPDLLRFSPSPFGSSKNLERYIRSALQARTEGIRYPFVIYNKESERYIGSTSFGNISNANYRIEIGWTWIDPAYHGTGLNKFCKHLLLTYAFEELKFKRVEFKSDARNIQSRKAMEKIGAKYEGLLRSHTLMLDGSRRDTVYYSILSEEWPSIRDSVFTDIY